MSTPTGTLKATGVHPETGSRARLRSGGGPSLPSGVAGVAPNDIAAIDVIKQAPGTLAPNAVSMIVISLKPGAAVPGVGRAP